MRATENDKEDIFRFWIDEHEYHTKIRKDWELSDDYLKAFENRWEFSTKDPNSFLVVCKYHDIAIAYSCFMIIEKPIYKISKMGIFSEIYVDEKFRRNKIGTIMLKRGLEWFNSKGINHLKVEYEESSIVGKNFWKKNGFLHTTSSAVRKLKG